jgi:hypothetical protein
MPKNFNYGHWISSKPLTPDHAAGFIYLIVNTKDNKFYIGKKFYRNRKGKRRGDFHRWEMYTSSSEAVNEDIKRLGKKLFKFYIIEEYTTLATLSWAEIWSLVTQKTPELNEMWYNRRIEKVGWAVKEPITEFHIKRLNYLIKKHNKKKEE